MKLFSKTDIGRFRSTNQDFFFAGYLDGGAALAVVCDGMGGANAGNVASDCAVKHISQYMEKSFTAGMSAESAEKTVRNAVESANIEIYDLAVNNPAFAGMGTTVVLALVCNDFTVIAHVGDSRIYLAGDTLVQLTRDHSVVQSLLESGKITPEDAKVHPRKNVITRALGVEENVTADSAVISFEAGETLLLCTDGLTNYLDENEILHLIKTTPADTAAELLVERANENGGGDNITVVTVTK